MTIILLYLFGALAISFLCSVLEAVLLSTPVSYISMKENQGDKTAFLMMKYKTNVDRPVAAILTLNTVAAYDWSGRSRLRISEGVWRSLLRNHIGSFDPSYTCLFRNNP